MSIEPVAPNAAEGSSPPAEAPLPSIPAPSRLNFAAICRQEAESYRESYRFGGEPFDPNDPDYDEDSRRMFVLADAFDALAALLAECEQLVQPSNLPATEADFIALKKRAGALIDRLAAGYQPPNALDQENQ